MNWIRRRLDALRSLGTQRGQATTVSTVVWLPMAFLALFTATAYNTWSFAHELAQGAAEIAAEDAGLSPVSAERGEQAGRDFLTSRGRGSIGEVTVTVTVNPDGTVAATVSGEARGILGVLVPQVTASAVRAQEPTR